MHHLIQVAFCVLLALFGVTILIAIVVTILIGITALVGAFWFEITRRKEKENGREAN